MTTPTMRFKVVFLGEASFATVERIPASERQDPSHLMNRIAKSQSDLEEFRRMMPSSASLFRDRTIPQISTLAYHQLSAHPLRPIIFIIE